METIYKGAAGLGRFTTSLRFYISIGIAVIMVAIAIYLFTRPEVKTAKVSGTVLEVNCTPLDKSFNCNLKVKYTTQDQVERTSNVMMTNQVQYTVGQVVNFSYELENPTTLHQTVISKKLVGVILIGVAVLLVGGSYVWKYITSKYEVAAAATGVGDVFGAIRSGFR